VIERTEKSLLDSRLQHYVYAYGEDKASDTREELEKELAEARKLREITCADYENRIKKMNKSHAKQCEDLCREVIDTNRENIRLKQQLADLTNGTTTTTNITTAIRRRSNTRRYSSWKASLKRNKGLQLRLLLAIFVFAGCVFFQSRGSILATRHGGGLAGGIVRRDSRQELFRDGDSSSSAAVVVPFRPEELLNDDESDDDQQSQAESTASTTTTANDDDASVALPETDAMEVAPESESSLQQEQRVVTSSSSNNDVDVTTRSSSNKKLPLRKRTGAWLHKRVAKLGSKIKKTFVNKKLGDEGRRVHFFLRTRHTNVV
jgi:hypothetical protein